MMLVGAGEPDGRPGRCADHPGKVRQVARLVARRIGIGDVLRQHALPGVEPGEAALGEGNRGALRRVHGASLPPEGEDSVKPAGPCGEVSLTPARRRLGAWPSPTPPQPAPPIDSMRGTLAVARALVESGRQVDLAGLDAGAAALCAAIAMLPPDSARPMLPALVSLLEEVDGLGAALTPR